MLEFVILFMQPFKLSNGLVFLLLVLMHVRSMAHIMQGEPTDLSLSFSWLPGMLGIGAGVLRELLVRVSATKVGSPGFPTTSILCRRYRPFSHIKCRVS